MIAIGHRSKTDLELQLYSFEMVQLHQLFLVTGKLTSRLRLCLLLASHLQEILWKTDFSEISSLNGKFRSRFSHAKKESLRITASVLP